MPAKIDPSVAGGIAVRGIEAALIEKDRVASSIARPRKKNDRIDRIVRNEVIADRRAVVTAVTKIDIIIDRARRLRRNRFRRLR